VGRADVLREVLNILRHHKQNAILLFGQRRIGKTSMLRELEAKLPTQGDLLTIFFDLQDQSRRSLGDILQALANKISDNLSNVNPNLDNHPEEAFRDWLVNIVSKSIQEKRLVLLLDEFDALASYDEQRVTNAFFPYLRGLLENIDPEKINFVFAVGRNAKDLNEIAGSLFKGIINHRVSLLKKDDTIKLIHLAENHLHWSKEAIERIWQQTNGHPFVTQCLCYTIWNAAYANEPNQVPEITLEKVNHAIHDTLEKSESAFEWLWAGLGPAEQVVAAALASAGAEPKNEKQLKHLLYDSGVQVIIQELQDAPRILQDWDLIEETDEKKYRFRVELLRRWIAENKPLHQAQGKLDALDPGANELYKVAKNFYKSNRFDAAIGSLRQVISINPHHVKAHLQLADILIKQRQDNEAREILEQLYAYNPVAARNPLVDVLINLAQLSNDKREQRKLYERVLEIDPKHGEPKRKKQEILNNQPFIYGNPIAPAQLIGRKKELRQIAGRILTGQSTIITGSPRSGKTSVLEYLIAPEKQVELYGDKADKLLFSSLDAYTWAAEFDQPQFWKAALEPLKERISANNSAPSLSETYQLCQDNQFSSFVLEKLIAQIRKKNWQLVIIIDGFDVLLHHPILNRAEFFGGLRLLASRSQGALTLVITSNASQTRLHQETQLFNRTGSPYFNFMGEIVLGALDDAEINKLLHPSDIDFTDNDCRFIKGIAGGHPYLLQVAASVLWETYENQFEEGARQQYALQEFYLKVKDMLNGTWQSWDEEMHKAVTSVALAHLENLNIVFPKKSVDLKSIISSIPSTTNLGMLEKYGFLIKDSRIRGGWGVYPTIFLLHFILDKFKPAYRRQLPDNTLEILQQQLLKK
jgi:AAA+ ATPase superfamily predicted ATPase